MNDQVYKHWNVEQDSNNITWLSLDVADTSTNTLSSFVLNELNTILDDLEARVPQAVIFKSAKKSGFIAGADVKEFTQMKDSVDALELIQRGQKVFNRIESLMCPSVAMIHGFCLGGGMELALACKFRVASDDKSTKVGLPEVMLGIHPGFGGTVRSIRKAGPLAAMNFMLSGRAMPAKVARKNNLVDEVVPQRQLERAAIRFALNNPSTKPLGFLKKLPGNRLLRPIIASQMRKQVGKKARQEHYPAPYQLIDLWQRHADNPVRMMEEEAKSVAHLADGQTARNLVRVFFLQEGLKALAKQSDFHPEHVHVIGGGVMGGDIAAWCAAQGYRVTIQDQKPEILARTMKRANKMYQRKFKRDRIGFRNAKDRLIPDHKGLGVKHADLVIEAIFEDADVKRQLYQSIEPHMKENAILATNTSSIMLENLSDCLARPERLVGLHFFNPVARMPLVEVVRGESTSEATMQAALTFAKNIRKLPLPVKSTPGFLVNRILMPYLLEAVEMVNEGIAPEVIDKAALDFGMPMGPIELADTVGLDICRSVAEILSQSLNVNLPENLESMVGNNNLGKKTGEGFYKWKKGKPVKNKNASSSSSKEIQDRMIMRLLNEATACLREKVVDNAELVDAGVIFGTGFAPFRGGPLHYIQHEGVSVLENRLGELEKAYGDRFTKDAEWAIL